VAQDCLTRLCLIEVGKLLGRFGFWFAPTFGGIPLLTRLYVVHISVLPALFTLAVAVHLLLVKRLKMAPSPFRKGPEPEPTRPFTHHLGELAALGLVLIGVLTVLAVLLPPGHGPAPVEGLEVTKPPWPLLWVYPVEDWVGVSGILWATLAIFAALLLVPVLDRSPRGPPRSAPMWPSPRWRAPLVDPPKTIARGLGRIEWCGAAGSCQSGEVPNPAGVELPLFR
jgi:ubiquinol-cytochrome c reductase cytochrome b subunit